MLRDFLEKIIKAALAFVAIVMLIAIATCGKEESNVITRSDGTKIIAHQSTISAVDDHTSALCEYRRQAKLRSTLVRGTDAHFNADFRAAMASNQQRDIHERFMREGGHDSGQLLAFSILRDRAEMQRCPI